MARPFWMGMSQTLPPPSPESEAQALRSKASEKRVLIAQLEREAKDLELVALRLDQEARTLKSDC